MHMGRISGRGERARLERDSFIDEAMHFRVYEHLSKIERDPELRALLVRLSLLEKKHMNLWKAILDEDAVSVPSLFPALVSLQVFVFSIIRRVMGIGFVTKLLGLTEEGTLARFADAIKGITLPESERRHISIIMRDENYTEEVLKKKIRVHEGELNYMRSIVLGLNDGLVEVLAAVVGFAIISRSDLIVIIGGLIIGVSGTLSMAGGAYLSSKSHSLIERNRDSSKSMPATRPRDDAFYTGAYYFIGALIPVLPFMAGISGYYGILASIITVSIVLTIASAVIAIISGTSIKRRIFEMLVISLGASLATIALSSVLKFHFGITI